tara:strand:- start:543 stop:974 length:432 start_codon:yes stop_codon:yes gene_type:complete
MKLTKTILVQLIKEELTFHERAQEISDPEKVEDIFKDYLEKYHPELDDEEFNYVVGEIMRGKRSMDLGNGVELMKNIHPETSREVAINQGRLEPTEKDTAYFEKQAQQLKTPNTAAFGRKLDPKSAKTRAYYTPTEFTESLKK